VWRDGQVRLTVLTAAEGAAWEASLLAELGRNDHGVDVARRCVDVVDLLSAAAAGLARGVLIDAQLRRFDADCHDRLVADGLAVVGVVESSAPADQDRLRSMGVNFFVASDAPVAVLLSVLESALGSTPESDFSFATSSSPLTVAPLVLEPDAEPTAADPQHRGAVVAVWGPTGAPGRTTVALGLADEMARLNRRCLLIDADVYGGVIAPVLGLLDESPGIAAACRQAQSRRLDPAELARLSWQVSPALMVLSGIARADRWPELRPTAIANVLGVAREVAAFTVLDLGFSLETDEELSFDTVAPRRNGATLAALDAADLILAVGTADPIGIQRLMRGLVELKAAGVSAPVWVVLNRVRRGPVPGDPQEQLTAALDRFAGQPAAAMLPYDRAATDRAIAAGQTLAEAAPNSALRRAIAELAAAVAGVPSAARGRRRR
jgi:Flp pilus assembly CpaE family ATPase